MEKFISKFLPKKLNVSPSYITKKLVMWRNDCSVMLEKKYNDGSLTKFDFEDISSRLDSSIYHNIKNNVSDTTIMKIFRYIHEIQISGMFFKMDRIIDDITKVVIDMGSYITKGYTELFVEIASFYTLSSCIDVLSKITKDESKKNDMRSLIISIENNMSNAMNYIISTSPRVTNTIHLLSIYKELDEILDT